MASRIPAHKRLGLDLSVHGNSSKRMRGFSSAGDAHLQAICAKSSCMFHDTIPIVALGGHRQMKGGMCRDFSCPHGIALCELLKTECSIIANVHTKDYLSSECVKLLNKHHSAMREISECYDNRHLINPFLAYWLTNFGALPRPATQRAMPRRASSRGRGLRVLCKE